MAAKVKAPVDRSVTSTPPAIVPALASLVDVARVAQLTGPGSVNATDTRWNISGADLGHMFWNNGSLYMVFGDTYGPSHGNWRSNTIARLVSPDPTNGLRIASMITDARGAAAELLGSLKVDAVEHTVIPTYGISVGNRMILHYMSVNRWLTPGRWRLNGSGLAYSDDGGKSWTKDAAVSWPGTSNFGQVAMVASSGDVYLLGIPGGRFGGVQIARVPQADILQLSDYRYWDGRAWRADAASAATVVPGPVGELSVRWSPSLRRWMMLSLDEGRAAVVLRTAPELTGPWSAETVVATARQFPGLYAPYLVPVDTGRDVYFTMSQAGPYEVFLMKGALTPEKGVNERGFG